MTAPSLRLRHRFVAMLALLAQLAGQPAVRAAEPDNTQLQQLLKRYPEADTNHDGVLSLEEAQAYAKIIRRNKTAKKAGDAAGVPATVYFADRGPAAPARLQGVASRFSFR